MKNNLLLLLMISSVTLLSGCVGSSSIDSSDTDSQNNEVVSVVSTGEDLPICGDESQAMPTSIISIEDNVKNCTSSIYTGYTADGLGGACFPSYKLHQGVLVQYDCAEEQYDETYICQIPFDRYTLFATTSISLGDGYENIEIGLQSKLIDTVVSEYSTSLLYCGQEDHCQNIKDTGAWSDGDNYFVAGYRDNDSQKYYVINNKLYNPGLSDINLETGSGSSAWSFGGIQNNRIIVHKIMDVTTNTNTMNNTYTLKTCEITQ